MAANSPLLSPAREAEIARLAASCAGSPVDERIEPEAIAAAAGIAFRYAPFPEDFDGVLIHHAGRFFIICNDRRFPRGSPRSRFTFAHELAHYFIPEHRAALAAGGLHFSRTEYSSEVPHEREADFFAARLLLPEPLFRRVEATAPGTKLDRIQVVADFLGTSVTATAYRALALDLLPAPAAVFRWNQLGEPASRRMSEATARLGRNYRGLAEAPPAGSLTAAAVAELTRGSAAGPSHVMDWFPHLTGYAPDDQDAVCEEVKSLGQFGWVTLVYRASTAAPGAPGP